MGKRETSLQTTKSSGCFICDRPHRARDCLRKENLNAIIDEDGENIETEAPMRAKNPLQLLNVILAKVTHRGLMYLELLTCG